MKTEKRWPRKEVFCYCECSDTIRTLPGNYLIANRIDGRWICDPDLAAPEWMAVKCFKALLNYDRRYGDGLSLLAAITPNN